MAENNKDKTKNKAGKTPKSIIRKVTINLFLTILCLAPLLGYVGTTLTIQGNSPIDKVPYVHWNGIDPHSEIYISWETSTKAQQTVLYGNSPDVLTQATTEVEAINVHHIKLSGLLPDSRYYYRVVDSDEKPVSDIGTFKTAPEQNTAFAPFNVTCISDTQQMWGTGHYDTIASSIAKLDTDFLMYAGDVGQEPDDQETWNFFFQQSAKFSNKIPIVTTPGNHDDITETGNKYSKYFTYASANGRANYTYTWGNVQFVMAQIGNMDDRDMDKPENVAHDVWLNATLEAGQQYDYRILMFHRQVFSSLGNDEGTVKRISAIVERYNVSLVMYGHIHGYERFYYNQHNYLLLGGGGGLQNSFFQTQEITQTMALGASFTQLFFTETGIKIKTMSPTFDVIDEINLVKQGGLVIPERITPNGGL